jgi:hypothetical protein
MAFRSRRGGADLLTTRRSHDVLEANARLSAAREAVWSTLWNPETSKVIWPEVLHSVVLPGTGPGVGEIHVEVQRTDTGKVSLSGVVIEAWTPPEFVRYSGLNEWLLQQSRSEMTLSSLEPNLTAVRWMMTLSWKSGVPIGVVEQTVESYRTFMTTYLRGSGRILNAPIDLDGPWRLT